MLRDLAALSLLAVIGLSCVGGSDPIADADSVGETAMASESGSMTDTETESGSTTETSTETTTDTSTETTESETTESETTESETTESETTETETGMDGPTPDLGVLAIIDVNPNSKTYNKKVHPLDYEGQLSGWYFGHAT